MFFNFQNHVRHIVLQLLDSSYFSSRAELNISIVSKYLLTKFNTKYKKFVQLKKIKFY